ncbi:MAG: GspH/FimT family pseudopilin [Pseudomonadota bacterium]
MRGFTLIELVVVVAVLLALAVVAAPRLFDRTGFDARGFHDQALSVIRFAQKTAVAQRRTVFVRVTAGGVEACYDAACAAPLTDPARGGALAVAAPSGIGLAPAATVSFDPLGRPGAGASINVTGDVPRVIVIEPETGYVHS